MNKRIEEQLKQLKIAKIDDSKSSENKIFIPKHVDVQFELNQCYLVKLDKSLLNLQQCAVFAANYNHGTVPKYEYYKIDVDKTIDSIIYVNAIAYNNELQIDLPDTWCGWLPVDKLEIIKKL